MVKPQKLAHRPQSLLFDLSEPLCRSPAPRAFHCGTIGLGIVAAMTDSGGKPSKLASPTRSDPIPIASPRSLAAELRPPCWEEEEAAELSEIYTCVISHVGGGSVRKRVYFDDGIAGNHGEDFGVFCESPPRVPPADFLSQSGCSLSRKRPHGLDIFMYRQS